MNLREIGWGWGDGNWIHLAQNRDNWLDFSNTAMNSCSITCGEIKLVE